MYFIVNKSGNHTNIEDKFTKFTWAEATLFHYHGLLEKKISYCYGQVSFWLCDAK